MITEIKEKRTSQLLVKLTESEMKKVRDFKKSNAQINVSFIIRQHLLKVINAVALRDPPILT